MTVSAVLFVLLIALTNLGLGYAVAARLRHSRYALAQRNIASPLGEIGHGMGDAASPPDAASSAGTSFDASTSAPGHGWPQGADDRTPSSARGTAGAALADRHTPHGTADVAHAAGAAGSAGVPDLAAVTDAAGATSRFGADNVARATDTARAARAADVPEATGEQIARLLEVAPDQWLSLLGARPPSARFAAAAGCVFGLELGRYRDELIRIDNRIRSFLDDPQSDELASLREQLHAVNAEYLDRQASAFEYLIHQQTVDGELGEIAERMVAILSGHGSAIETVVEQIDRIDVAGDPLTACRRLVVESGNVLDRVHLLRDRSQEVLIGVLGDDGRLDGVDPLSQRDQLTGLINRTGFEAVLCARLPGMAASGAKVSVAIVDIDRFSGVNDRFGVPVGDRVLVSLARLTDDMTRSERGQDRAARYDGQSLVILFDETSGEDALVAVERVRQTIEQTTYRYRDTPFNVTVSCALSELHPGDDAQTLLARLSEAVRAAKKAGRNITCYDLGLGPELATPPELNIRPQEWQIVTELE